MRSALTKVLVGFYLLLVLALLAAAVGIWRLHCESFGCMGIGVAWFAWVIAFLVILGIGLFTRSKVASVVSLARICKAIWWLQLAVGSVLLVIWFAKKAA
jgi:hypothetical protein